MIRLVKSSFMVGVLTVGSALLYGMDPGLVPTIVQPTGSTTKNQVTLPLSDTIKRGKKIQELYDAVNSDMKIQEFCGAINPNGYYPWSYEQLLENDPWLLHECEPHTGLTLEMYVAQRCLNPLDKFRLVKTGYHNGWTIPRHIDYDSIQKLLLRGTFQYVLAKGKKDQRFIDRLDELKSFLKNNERLCEDLITDFKEYFPDEDLWLTKQSDEMVPANYSLPHHEEPGSSSFWMSWKGIGLGLGAVTVLGGLAWWYTHGAAQSADALDGEDTRTDDS